MVFEKNKQTNKQTNQKKKQLKHKSEQEIILP